MTTLTFSPTLSLQPKTLIKPKNSEILDTTSNTRRSLKSRLKNGETLYGLFLATVSPTLAEIAGLSGYDYVIVDLEHGPGGISDALACLRALSASQTPAIIRVPDHELMWVKKSLDIGPQGIMFPMIDSPKTAKKLVSYCRYPLHGTRGGAHHVLRASGYGLDHGYESNLDDEILIICQVESEKGVMQIEEIASLDGVDCVHMGPTDLSTSMGYMLDRGNKNVKEMLRTAEKGVLKTTGGGGGAYLGGVATPVDTLEDMRPRGYHMIAVGVDIAMFRNACVEQVKSSKRKAVSNGIDHDCTEIDKDDGEEKYMQE